jgi:hypothetical protein
LYVRPAKAQIQPAQADPMPQIPNQTEGDEQWQSSGRIPS